MRWPKRLVTLLNCCLATLSLRLCKNIQVIACDLVHDTCTLHESGITIRVRYTPCVRTQRLSAENICSFQSASDHLKHWIQYDRCGWISKVSGRETRLTPPHATPHPPKPQWASPSYPIPQNKHKQHNIFSKFPPSNTSSYQVLFSAVCNSAIRQVPQLHSPAGFSPQAPPLLTFLP